MDSKQFQLYEGPSYMLLDYLSRLIETVLN